jgi:formate dehydrogenase subunit delta
MTDIEQMIKMANQIAENFSFHEDQAARTADHIQRFWAPTMRRKLFAYIADSGEGVSAPVVEAFKQIEV